MSLASEFKEFAMKGNVVDMAVGVIVGAAFGKIVSSLVGNVIMPVLGKADRRLQLHRSGVELWAPTRPAKPSPSPTAYSCRASSIS